MGRVCHHRHRVRGPRCPVLLHCWHFSGLRRGRDRGPSGKLQGGLPLTPRLAKFCAAEAYGCRARRLGMHHQEASVSRLIQSPCLRAPLSCSKKCKAYTIVIFCKLIQMALQLGQMFICRALKTVKVRDENANNMPLIQAMSIVLERNPHLKLEGLQYEVLEWCLCRLEAWFTTDADNISLKNWDQVCSEDLMATFNAAARDLRYPNGHFSMQQLAKPNVIEL